MGNNENKPLPCYLCDRVETKERNSEGVPVCKKCKNDHLIETENNNEVVTGEIELAPIDELDLGLGEDDPWADGFGWAPNFDRH